MGKNDINCDSLYAPLLPKQFLMLRSGVTRCENIIRTISIMVHTMMAASLLKETATNNRKLPKETNNKRMHIVDLS